MPITNAGTDLDARRHELLSRRAVLGGVGLGAAILSPVSAAWSAPRKATRRGRIDVHHHVGPPPGVAADGGGQPWTPEIAIEEMDRNGVGTGIGFPGPIPVSADLERGRKLARDYNDYASRIGRDHAGRFGLFASLPMHDTEGTLKEIEYAGEALKSDGFGIVTSYRELWLGDRQFRPIFE